MHTHCFIVSKNGGNACTFVCKFFGLKIQSHEYFDKSHVWVYFVVVIFNTFLNELINKMS